MPIKDLAEVLALTTDSVKSCLKRLAKKSFDWNGRRVPVITRLEGGHRGATAVYQDNLTLYCLDPDGEPPKNALQHGEGA